ncbi:hypothetical protein [Dokdonella sp.]|uniref:hypothetical protein n=1 Tax=Dokdonella sp. TaxID=2291710 RepID=UPI003C3E4C22
MRTLFVLACLLALATQSVAARQPYAELEKRFSQEQMHATGLDTLSSEQLKLLNGLVDVEIAKIVEARIDQVRKESARPETTELSGSSPRSSNFVGLEEEPIRSRLVGPTSGWEPGTVFQLENGQQWKVLKGTVKLRETLQAPQIKLVPGFAGRWFLQVVEDMPKARVYRID